MMSSRVLSRLLPVAEGDVSVLEGMRQGSRPYVDVEAQREPSAEESFHDYEDDPDRLLFEGANDDLNDQPHPSPSTQPSAQTSPTLDRIRPRWLDNQATGRLQEDEDVPKSLLMEGQAKQGGPRRPGRPKIDDAARARVEAQWKTAQERQGLHASTALPPGSRRAALRQTTGTPLAAPDPRADALWLYTNANNLDAFLLEVYQYYVEHGVWSVLLARALGLLTELFVFSFAMFLSTCVDFSLIPTSHSTAEIMISKCMSKASWTKNAALFLFVIYWLSSLARYVKDSRRLFKMYSFFLHVLGINDSDIQTVSWVRVVDGIVKVQNANVATANPPVNVKRWLNYSKPQQRMNAESIANRLMRKDNYYVAMYNKDIFDFTLPLPFVGSRQFYSKSLEWCIDFCLTNFVFDEQGSIRPFCLDVKNRKALINALRTRLQFAAATSVLIAPFNILRFCVIFFFRYYTEFTRNPSRVSARTFTPFAEWKIREFNELEHLFQRRLRQAYPFANDYLKQFPKDKTDQACRFVAFVSGAVAAVLAIATLFDPELIVSFEVTPGRTAVFWLPVLIGLFGFAHGMLPDENEVHDPVLHLKEVLMFTHYMPAHWKGRLHSNEVRAEFSAMYQLKVLVFIEEILSLIVAPWILLRNASHRSERIVDFFREQTVHIDGIGYQCNFAVFGFKKDLNAEDPTTVLNEPDGLRDDYYGLKDDKMAASVQNFMQYYSHYNQRQGTRRTQGWQPPPAWPPVLSTAAIAEDAEIAPAPARTITGSRVLSSRPAHRPESRKNPRGVPPPLSPQQAPRVWTAATERKKSELLSESSEARAPPVSESRLMAQDSDLRDYVDAPSKDQLESDTDDGEAGEVGKHVGVLGMLYQLSKAHTEKGTGVNI